MLRTFVVLALVLSIPTARADETVPLSSTPLRLSPIDPPEPGGTQMKQVGIGFLVVSAVALAVTSVGVGLMARECPGDIDKSGCTFIPGAITTTAGALMTSTALSVGLPLFVIGRRRERRAAGALALGPSIEPGGLGVAARYTVRF